MGWRRTRARRGVPRGGVDGTAGQWRTPPEPIDYAYTQFIPKLSIYIIVRYGFILFDCYVTLRKIKN